MTRNRAAKSIAGGRQARAPHVGASLAAILLCLAGTGAGIGGAAVAAGVADTSSDDGDYVYRLGPGDKLQITTYGEDKLTGTFTVNAEGVVPFPLLGDVPAKGLTVSQFRKIVVAELSSRFIRNPSVTVDVLNYRNVYILGEVARPGEFPYTDGLTVNQLVAKAGGFTFRANRHRYFVQHESEHEENKQKLRPSARVRPGDTIRIGTAYF